MNVREMGYVQSKCYITIENCRDRIPSRFYFLLHYRVDLDCVYKYMYGIHICGISAVWLV